MEAICSSETWVDTQRTSRGRIPEDDTLHYSLLLIENGIHKTKELKSGVHIDSCVIHTRRRETDKS
jgi:hypothetical protein